MPTRPKLLHRAGTREGEAARDWVLYMKKREFDAAVARAKRLVAAIEEASDRLKDESTPLVSQIASPQLSLKRVDGSVGAEIAFDVVMLPSWRVGHNPGDKFFELKLIPELRALVIGVIEDESTVRGAAFFIEPPLSQLIVAYTPQEIGKIIRLLKTIKPFPARTSAGAFSGSGMGAEM